MKVLMKKKDAVMHFDNTSGLADAIEISPQAINQWGEYIPETSVGKIMAIAPAIPFSIERRSEALISPSS